MTSQFLNFQGMVTDSRADGVPPYFTFLEKLVRQIDDNDIIIDALESGNTFRKHVKVVTLPKQFFISSK